MKAEIKTVLVAEWQYTEESLSCTCRIDGHNGLATLVVRSKGRQFPDCLKVKAWAKQWLAENPTTAEEFCEAAVAETGAECEVTWYSDHHGPIRVSMG